MELQGARLVLGLLDAGWRVTVIARACTIAPRPGLRFVRVRGPRRPFPIAYPTFAVVGTVLAAFRGRALLHTTGAIVANRADIASVHYCHRAARRAVGQPRVGAGGASYRANAVISSRMALAGEWWSYRPGRTRRLSAVSNGVARELICLFPRMTDAVRTVPNGVDLAEFQPDACAREVMRTRLGIGADTSLAVFAGGDWQRKGLMHAVGALRFAPAWHLAVAGKGDASAFVTAAEAAGTRDRLHLLGRMKDMPAVYVAADAFVFPTAYEAFPLAMLEAAASGLPLLVTRVNGAEDLVEEDRNGWFIRAEAQDIGRRMTQLSDDPGLANRMGTAARESAARFDWQTMIDGYLAVYAEIVADRV